MNIEYKDKLNIIQNSVYNIKNAIIEKGVQIAENEDITTFAEKISRISGGGGGGGETTRFYILPLENTEISAGQLGRLYTDGAVQYSFDDSTWHEFEFETKTSTVQVSDFYSNNLVYVRWTKQFYEELLTIFGYESFYLCNDMELEKASELIFIKEDNEYVWFVGNYGSIVDDPGRFMFAGNRGGMIRELGYFMVDVMMLESEGSTVLCEGNGDMIENAQFTHDYDNETVSISMTTPIPVKVLSTQKFYLKHGVDKVIYGGDSLKINLDCFYTIGGDLLELSGQPVETYSFFQYFNKISKLVSCGDLLFPETISYNPINGSFDNMFSFCNDLLVGPKILPAMELQSYCYNGMFANCKGLKYAPVLPAMSVKNRSYSGMFANCESLVNPPDLPATTLDTYCYESMFSGCINLTSCPDLPATTLADNCYMNMFDGCKKLNYLVNAAKMLPATTLADNCYYNMFRDCTSLFNAPYLPATILNQYEDAYSRMFYNCTNLCEIHCNIRFKSDGVTEITSIIGSSWFTNVKSGGNFYKNPEWSGPTSRGVNTIPSDWKIVDWV